jgi:hypothetical protein
MERLTTGGLLILALLAAQGLSLVETDAQPSQRSGASIKIENLVAAMNVITGKPYSFDQKGTLIGRTEVDRLNWNDLAMQMSDAVVSARPSEVDAKALDDLTDQLNDPIAWDPNILDYALGHIGSAAIVKLTQIIKSSPDSLRRYYLSEHLARAVSGARNADIDDHAIDEVASLLNHSDSVVRVLGASQALGAIGPRARRALPALQRELEMVRREEGGVRFGRPGTDIVGIAISRIKGEPIHLPY